MQIPFGSFVKETITFPQDPSGEIWRLEYVVRPERSRFEPIVFIFTSTGVNRGDDLEDLLNPRVRALYEPLANAGCLCVWIDLPSRADMTAWIRHTCNEPNYDLGGLTALRINIALDRIRQLGRGDRNAIGIIGDCRGALPALRYLAHPECESKYVALLSPVTELYVLKERADAGYSDERYQPVLLAAGANYVTEILARKLSKYKLWMCVGNNDQRVDSRQAIGLARGILGNRLLLPIPPYPIQVPFELLDFASHIELHVLPSLPSVFSTDPDQGDPTDPTDMNDQRSGPKPMPNVLGHMIHFSANQLAGQWLLSQFMNL